LIYRKKIKKQRRNIPLLVFLFTGVLVGSLSARTVPVSILFTADLCGRISPSRRGAYSGGIPACASLVEQERLHQNNVILIDCGNWYTGSYDNRFTQPGQLGQSMQAMGYDAWIPGWRDWSLGTGNLNAYSEVPALAANIAPGIRLAERPLAVQPYMIRDLKGIRVGIIGLSASSALGCYPVGELDDIQFINTMDALSGTMTALREKEIDVVVLALASQAGHRGLPLHKIRNIVQSFPEIDVILSGGYGRTLPLGRAFYSSLPSDTESVGKVSLLYDTVKNQVTRTSASTLQMITGEDAVETKVHQRLSRPLAALRKEQNRVVGNLSDAVTGSGKTSGHSPAGLFLARAVAYRLDADVVFFQWPVGSDIPKGDVTVRDVVYAYPDNTFWGTLLLTPPEIRTVLKENDQYAGGDYALGAYGIICRGETSTGRLERVDGSVMRSRKRYKVAFPRYVMNSGEGHYPAIRSLAETPVTRRELTDVDNYDAVISYIEAAGNDNDE